MALRTLGIEPGHKLELAQTNLQLVNNDPPLPVGHRPGRIVAADRFC
jgi:hypothetical protein